MRIPEVVIGGVKTACLSRAGLATLMLADCLEARAAKRAPKLVFSVNGHSMARAAREAEFRRVYEEADLIHADGQPVVLASRLLTRTPIPERSATTDFFHDAAKTAAARGLSFYLLGASESVNARCAAEMQRLYPGLRIAGRRDGYFARQDEAGICAGINASRADVVWVGLGLPLEQSFCVRNKHRLNAGWLVTCGGCFDFAAGDYARAPFWMREFGLEWLFRVIREPRRLFWRYMLTNPRALYLMLTQSRAGPA
ncbi:MAG TPA: WecB/TagA/CpsF family glycosyltransferase [Rhizomicrobium sp.]|nr:WecB/TagA/CpsF family glycosyltransferase [Rhizomicrobium sp.]